MNFDQLWALFLNNLWAIITTTLAALAIIIPSYTAVHKTRWHKYRCRALPYTRLFRGGEYGYDPTRFLHDISSAALALQNLQKWYMDDKPILLVGPAGIGKSRLVTQFLGNLRFWDRLWRRVLMPTPDELANRTPPLFPKGTILFLNDLHEYKDVADLKLLSYLGDKRFKVVATIASEKYDSDWSVLSRFSWNECKVTPWSESDGRRLADARGKNFSSNTFRGTPLSVLAPEAEMKRAYELLSSDRKAVLQALKIVKAYLGCFADFKLISAIPDKAINYPAFLDVVSHGYWCKTYESRALLADGIEEFVNYEVQLEDAYKLQLLLSHKDPPLENASEYLYYLGKQFNRLEDHSRALQCYNRSLELDQFRNTLLTKNLLLAEIESRKPETRSKARLDMDKRPGVTAHVWATGGRAYSSFARIAEANGMLFPAVLTGMTVDLTFAIKGAGSSPVSGVMSEIGASTHKNENGESWNAIAIYVPPGFTVSHAYPAFLAEPYDYGGIRVLTAPPCDPYGPGWRVICVSRDAFDSGGEGPHVAAYDDGLIHRFIELTSDRKCYYVRIIGVTSPVVAGGYCFKIALLDSELSYSIGITRAGMSAQQGERPPRFIRLEDSPVMLVQGEVTPASISGTIRHLGHNEVLQSLSEAGRVYAKMTMRVDPYTGAQRRDLPKVDAVGYFNATAQGHYKVEGLAPGIYDLYASAAGFPTTLIAPGVSVQKGQSLHFDGSLRPGVVIRGNVFSKRKLDEEPWLETTCVNIELYGGPTLEQRPDPSAGLIAWSPSHWICKGKHNFPDGSNVSSRYYTHLDGHLSDSKAGRVDSGNAPSMPSQTDSTARGPRDVGPPQSWFVQAGTTLPFVFQFGIKDEFGAPRDFDGMVPQLDATWTNGLTPGRYYVRAWVRGYDQSASDGSTFYELSFAVTPNDGAKEVILSIDLHPSHPLKSN